MTKLNYWNSQSDLELFKKYVGDTYPDIDSALNAKNHEAGYISSYLNLDETKEVIDLGPGYGLIANFIAPKVKQLHCVDISSSFLDKCNQTLAHHDNIKFHLINYGDMSPFKNIDAVYCVAVFIHFNIFDVAIYLKEIHRILTPGGTFLFDFYDADNFDYNDAVVQRHLALYNTDRNAIFTNINFNNKKVVENIANNIGFKLEQLRDGKQPLYLATKLII